MQSNELRIGNYVIYGGSEVEMNINEFIHFVRFPETYEPIPLTENWLFRLGFERHDEGSVSAQFSYGKNPVTQDYLIYLKWIKDYENDYKLNGFPFYNNGHFEIKTVHQLQNLYFSLCGAELELLQVGNNN